LTNVNGLAYTWDNNGNLLSDGGVTTYTYDTANRLVKFNQGAALTYTMAYNGQGDRVSVVVNGVPMTYTLDLNAGLTQTLADGTVILRGNIATGSQQYRATRSQQ
jgi:YD repeat-containing protein